MPASSGSTQPAAPAGDFTLVLQRAQSGDEQAPRDLLALVYTELRRLAAAKMAREAAGHTLQPTALINEVYLRLIEVNQVQWRDRAHFLAVAARVMRRILVDFARARGNQKRGGGSTAVALDEVSSRARRAPLT